MHPIPPQPYEIWAIIFLFFLLPIALMALALMQRGSYEWTCKMILSYKSTDDEDVVESMLARLRENQRHFARVSKILYTILSAWLGMTILVFLLTKSKLHHNIASLPWIKIGIVYVAWILVLSVIVIWRKKTSNMRILTTFARDFGSDQ